MRWLIFSALVALTTISVLNWRSQAQTQQKLEALAAALAERPAVAAEPPAAPVPVAPPAPEPIAVPRELAPIRQTPYVIEAPDVLLIEAVKKCAEPNSFIRLPEQPISGQFTVRADGTVGLGLWGQVAVSGLTLEQASAAIRNRVAKVRPTELTAENLVVWVEVLASNSKKYYIIADGVDGVGEAVYPFPCTGSETVLDALANVNGLCDMAQCKISVARRTSNGQSWQVLPVDWTAITQNGVVHTNYQLFPGDRLYVTRKAQ
ncbi:polysaccharide biosynthesis/export family protein [Frigoriglobus tundricola]|uniref:Putative polysaccharide export protein n=1 Tax=Frigoriglobus tundricola TaxID=2774151 RepID=A0A6M5YV07_9BACT|nr:polysaccharide biosynthesis/export family protein [Frigoriglobus tundricola]QJW96722.1 putative polysaccharide export protein [Frigoriglobus tundricola]